MLKTGTTDSYGVNIRHRLLPVGAMPLSHIEEAALHLHSFLTMAPYTVSAQLHVLATIPPGQKPQHVS
jgi:hypothetical protein